MARFPPERRICFAETVGETTPGNPNTALTADIQPMSTWWNGREFHLLSFYFKVLCSITNLRLFFFNSHLLKWLKTIHQGGGAMSLDLCLCWKWNSWAASSFLVTIGSNRGMRELDMALSPCFWFWTVKDFWPVFLLSILLRLDTLFFIFRLYYIDFLKTIYLFLSVFQRFPFSWHVTSAPAVLCCTSWVHAFEAQMNSTSFCKIGRSLRICPGV